MNQTLEHRRTKTLIDTVAKARPHAVVVKAPSSVTREYIAKNLAKKLVENAGNPEAFYHIEPSNGSTKIAAVRQLYRLVYRKTSSGSTGDDRVVIMHESHKLTLPAQNALLKLLEEPPPRTFFILTTERLDALLPTVRSRAQSLVIYPLAFKEFTAALKKYEQNEATLRQLYVLAGGDAVFGQQLASDKERLKRFEQAKRLLTLPVAQAVIELQAYASDRSKALQLVDDILRLCHSGMRHAANQRSRAQWLKRSESALEAAEALVHNGNVRVNLDWLLLEMRHSGSIKHT